MSQSAGVDFGQYVREYAGYWVGCEEGVHRDLLDGSPDQQREALCRGAIYFGVIRSFRTAYDTKRGFARLEPALETLRAYRTRLLEPSNLNRVVADLVGELRLCHEMNLLSASSKFLWLLRRDPVIIFDSRARAGLGTPAANYQRYIESWLAGYSRTAIPIREACRRVWNDDPEFNGSPWLSDEWFSRRVYDVYLWNTGGSPSSPVRYRDCVKQPRKVDLRR